VNRQRALLLAVVSVAIAGIAACSGTIESTPTDRPATSTRVPPTATLTPTITVRPVERDTSIPTKAVKISPGADEHPPKVYSDEYEQPVPLPGRVNTAGAEDSPFITPDGDTLYFFFTPDLSIPVERQIRDGVTGIYVSKKTDGGWGEPQRVVLQDPGKLALDGCPFVHDDVMWFCSARTGYTGVHWFTAEFVDGAWRNWTNADFNPKYEVGELDISADGTELYFASSRAGGRGDLDIWVSKWIDGGWGEPVDVAVVNSVDAEGWPAVSPSGDELWFSRNYGIWRSKKVDGDWQEPELIISPLAGEPTIDAAGNVYFVHHFLVGDRLVEADIYVAYKKQG
jgi:hypothetical protein